MDPMPACWEYLHPVETTCELCQVSDFDRFVWRYLFCPAVAFGTTLLLGAILHELFR
jgi:hypothetical protein